MGEPTQASLRVIELVLRERERQRAKWGDDPHPDVGQAWWLQRQSRTGPLTWTDELRAMVEAGEASDGGAGWLEILFEEVGEARDAAEMLAPADEGAASRARRRALLRAELVQVAAVAVAWVEDLERRDAAEVGDGGQG